MNRWYRRATGSVGIGLVALLLIVGGAGGAAAEGTLVPALPEEGVRSVYLPATAFTERRIGAFLHYAEQAGINAAVLHVKDPRGRLHWRTENRLALAIGAGEGGARVAGAVRRLRDAGIYTIAKVDLFADDLLARRRPEMAVPDSGTGAPWMDRNGLRWTRPCDLSVWAYNIALCRELVALGFHEIQFDYIRFPSDGELGRIPYGAITGKGGRVGCIEGFLAAARGELSPLGVTLSADIFGLTAWKRKDFGVGQVLEAMAPHLDVLCPMLYPSHFPEGFLGWEDPGDHPEEIIRRSLVRMRRRTFKTVRPWIQGFWYTAPEISRQLDGIEGAGGGGWAVWNPSGNYARTWEALARRMDTSFTRPVPYPGLGHLRKRSPRVIGGAGEMVIHVTDYVRGYTILSLEPPAAGAAKSYSTPGRVIATLDEAVMDRILQVRAVPFGGSTTRRAKVMMIARLLSTDIGRSLRRIRPMPIYIRWSGECRFSLTVPEEELAFYRSGNASTGPSANL